MYQRSEQVFGQAGLTASLSLDQIIVDHAQLGRFIGKFAQIKQWFEDADLAPDLGVDIGSFAWFRGLITCALLCFGVIMIAPPIKPIFAPIPAAVSGKAWEETRAQSIAPSAWGSDTGHHMAANALVVPLGNTPERPSIDLTATLGQGDGFARVLERAGISSSEARHVADLVAAVTPLSAIEPGTTMKMTLGRRDSENASRPLESLQFRARFDLELVLRRAGNQLTLGHLPIAVDRTPLRIQGRVGDSLYRSARIAGAPPRAVEAYIKAISSRVSLIDDVPSDARFDMVIEHARAETGEVQLGRLLYAGLERGQRKMQLLQWSIDGHDDWYEASGVGQRRGGMSQPVVGRITSGFGMRFHPILGYTRMHRGVDFGAAYGSPIHAVTDGLVSFAGRHGGNGNYVLLTHSSVLGSSYSHMSRILVTPGSRVVQGQVIGYVGSTGLSTGPHLHFEVFKNGVVVNPLSVSFASTSLLSGKELAAFKTRLYGLLNLPVGGSLQVANRSMSIKAGL